MKRLLILILFLITLLPLAACSVEVKEEIFNVTDYGEKNSVGIQKAIDACTEGGVVYLPEGTYEITDKIVLKSNITLRGDFQKTVLSVDKASAIKNGKYRIFAGLNNPYEKDVYGDKNIVIENLILDAHRIKEVKGDLISFLKATDIKIRNCTFRNNRDIAVGFGGCKNVTVSECIFENNGLEKPSKISSPALWTDLSYNNYPINITVEDCIFRNNNWSGCYFMPHGGKITRCQFIDNGESSIFTNGNARDIEYSYNYITGAQKSNISASGIETGASNCLIEGNIIEKCGHEGISLTNLKGAVVKNNLILNNGHEKASMLCGICIYTLAPLAENEHPTSDILIENNLIGNVFNSRLGQTCGVGFWNNGGGTPITNVTVINNSFTKVSEGNVRSFTAVEKTVGNGCSFEPNKLVKLMNAERENHIKALEERNEAVRTGKSR